ncbi:MAG: DoxX family protein [Chloroflexi bacterium]|nr:MAG: DoxX family protein [Chloroflexota bacterium]
MEDNRRSPQMWRQLFGERFDQIDRTITRWLAETGIVFLRISVGVVFFWFGALKLFPDASPATDLIRDSISFLPSDIFIPFLGVWEMLIGLGFITGRYLRVTILIMVLQMFGAVSPIVLNPDAVWDAFPFKLTLEGQYIVKNIVLIAAAMVIGATVRGGELTAEPEVPADKRGNGSGHIKTG